jgi:hypothetical protein
MHRYYWHNTKSEWSAHFLSLLYSRLIARGHPDAALHSLFMKAAKRMERSKIPEPKTVDSDALRDAVLLHVPYHPQNPPRNAIRLAFQDHLKPVLERHKDPALRRLTIAYSRAPNIADTVRINRLAPSADTP